jgi:osmotically-inducible protein OsmY
MSYLAEINIRGSHAMKRLQQCKMNVEICEDCKHWEPIPFHHNGGICMSEVAISDARPFLSKDRAMMKKAPWSHLREMISPRREMPTNRTETNRAGGYYEDMDNWAGLWTPPGIGDRELKKRVKRALSRNPNIDERQISIQVKDGVVQFSGLVGSVAEKRLAEDEVRAAPGVKEVTNSIRVVSIPYKSDVQIMGEILRCLSLCLRLDLSKVSVQVRNHVAFLKGTVSSHRLKSAAEQLVMSMPFVANVVNHLNVSDRLASERKRFQSTVLR